MSEKITDIRDDRAKLCAIFDALSDGVVVCDLAGEIVEINDTACALFATARHAAIGRPLGNLASGAASEPATAWLGQAAPGDAAVFEWQCRNAGGEPFCAEITLRRTALAGHDLGLAVVRDISERNRLMETLAAGTMRDPLTGLPNRRDLDDILPYETARYERYGGYLCIALARVDEHPSHAMADAALKKVAEFVRGRLRKSDYVARVGDEEFVLLIHDTKPDIAARMLSRMRAALQHQAIDEADHPIGISFGLTGYHLGDTPDDMLTRLKEAVELARSTSHHRVVTA